jgi:hypothetical protein
MSPFVLATQAMNRFRVLINIDMSLPWIDKNSFQIDTNSLWGGLNIQKRGLRVKGI